MAKNTGKDLIKKREQAIKAITEFDLKPKQLQFILKLVEVGGNQTEAAMQIYKCKDRNSAAALASTLLTNEKVKEAYHSYLMNIVASEDAALTVTHDVMRNAKTSSDKLRAADMVFKVHGTYADRNTRGGGPKNVQVVNVNVPDTKNRKLKKIIDVEPIDLAKDSED